MCPACSAPIVGTKPMVRPWRRSSRRFSIHGSGDLKTTGAKAISIALFLARKLTRFDVVVKAVESLFQQREAVEIFSHELRLKLRIETEQILHHENLS